MPSTLNPACPLCGLRFGNKPLLDLHVREDHRQRVFRAQNGDRDPGTHQVLSCAWSVHRVPARMLPCPPAGSRGTLNDVPPRNALSGSIALSAGSVSLFDNRVRRARSWPAGRNHPLSRPVCPGVPSADEEVTSAHARLSGGAH